MSVEFRVEVWDSTWANKLGIIPLNMLTDAAYLEEMNGDYSFEFMVSIDYAGLSNLIERNTLIVATNGVPSFTKSARKFRIQTITKTFTDAGEFKFKVHAEHITFDLLSEVIPDATPFVGMKVSDLVTKILTGSTFTSGTIDPGDMIISEEFVVGGKNRLDNLKELVERIPNNRLSISDAKAVSILRVSNPSSATPVATFQPEARNMLSTEVSGDSRRLVTRMYAIGGGTPRLNLSKTWHPIETYTLDGINQNGIRVFKAGLGSGCYTTSGSRTYYAEQANSKGTYRSITGFTPEEQGYGTADLINYTTGGPPLSSVGMPELVTFYYSDDGGTTKTPVNYIEDRSVFTTYGAVDGIAEHSDLEFTENLARDPFFFRRTYVSGKHPNLNVISSVGDGISPTFTENTNLTYIKNGTKSQKIQTTGYGQGCYVQVSPLTKNNDSIYFSVKVLIYLVSGKVRLDVEEHGNLGPSSAQRQFVFPPFATDEPIVVTSTGKFVEVTFNGIKNEATTASDPYSGSHYINIYIYQHESAPATAEWYLDSIQVEPLPSATDGWIDGSSKKILWDRAYDEMVKVNKIYTRYIKHTTSRCVILNSKIRAMWRGTDLILAMR
jgi:hypothetical protein